MHYLIKDLNQDEKPREKILKYGPKSLSDSELIAILFRSGGKQQSAVDLARETLNRLGKLNELINVDVLQIKQIKNIDLAKAASLVAAIEIGVRLNLGNTKKMGQIIKKPTDAVNLLRTHLHQLNKEHLYLITLNTRHHIIAKDLISVGTVNETLMSPREIFRQALIRNATSIVLVHNHPSNDPSPSNEDIEATQSLFRAATDVGISLLDHIIITDTSFVSMKSLGILNRKEVKEHV